MAPILFIAPFLTMANVAKEVAADMNLPLVVEIADDFTAKAVVKKYPEVEVVISRGGVAEQIKEIEGITVTEVTMSMNELLGLLDKLTRRGLKNIGIVSRGNLFDGIMGDFEISQSKIYMRSCKDEQEIVTTVNTLYEQGIDAVIGCRFTYETASKCGITAEILESSKLSVKKAIDEAVRIVKAKEKEKLQAAQLAAIINNIEEGVIAVSSDKRISFCNNLARQVCENIERKLDDEHIDKLLQYRNKESVITINDKSVLAKVIPLEFNNQNKGDVITFQEVSNIQASERKIRFSLYQKGLYAKNTFENIVGHSDVIKKTVQKAGQYARFDSNLLIYGETGTGKEVFAQSIHNQSRRKKGPFVSVNTASLAPSLLESELFGYVEGAFTGARKGGKVGLFELAHGGTIFLDEIGELSPDIQSRLLRVLQEKEIMRLGDDKIIPVDVRVVCATNRDLNELVQKGGFRSDLYYRINVLSLRLPPLRERSEDIADFFTHFIREFAAQEGRQITITHDAMQLLMTYYWPGNVRELRNIAELLVCCESEIIKAGEIADIFQEKQVVVSEGHYFTIQETDNLKIMELQIIKHFLSRYSQEEVCRRLGISRVTLWRKMQACFKNETNEMQ
jgi:transcriptional regulator with PAS, ATPase and Fis domain